jgi:hypothetical protein
MVQDAEPGDMPIFATGQMKVFAANDTLEQCCGQYRILRFESEKQTKELLTGDFLVNQNTTSLIATMPSLEMQTLLIIEWTVQGRRYFNHFITGSPPFNFETFRNWCSTLDKIYKEQKFS